MRKTIVLLVALSLVVTTAVAASAGKKKRTVKDAYPVTAPVPYPVTATINEVGCLEASEGIGKNTFVLAAKWTGVLDVKLTEFLGDWDLHIIDESGTPIASSTTGNTTVAEEQVTIFLRKGREIGIVACNWLGSANATVTYSLTEI